MTPGNRLFLKQVGLAPKQALTTQCRICEGPVAEGQRGHGSGVRQRLQIPCAIHYGVPPAHLTIAFRSRPRWLKPEKLSSERARDQAVTEVACFTRVEP